MIPIISIVGKSNSGKTTLVEKIIPEIKRRGYKVASVKHNQHGFDIDHEGKDSWRHRKAGTHTTVIYSMNQLALIRDMDHNASLQEIRDLYINDVDIIIAEGHKYDNVPKIEIFRKEVYDIPVSAGDNNLIAFVSDEDIDMGVPKFGLNDISGISQFIEERFLKNK
ncbi:MAG: molybdopterin-guanine dinucleotide biosynthesis protein B [Spirochaetes bacterium]|nr:molybdopterin-guanine dinucleotide biosynthesis protein B [Spirochaetota bacterium]